MTIAEKYAAQWMPNGEVTLVDLIQAAVDEAQSVAVVGGLFDLEKLESLGWQIAVCQMCGTHASAIKPAAELATLREQVARFSTLAIANGNIALKREQERDELRKDAERYRWLRRWRHPSLIHSSWSGGRTLNLQGRLGTIREGRH